MNKNAQVSPRDFSKKNARTDYYRETGSGKPRPDIGNDKLQKGIEKGTIALVDGDRKDTSSNSTSDQTSGPATAFEKAKAEYSNTASSTPPPDAGQEQEDGAGDSPDWSRWLLAGGSGLLAYALASSLFGGKDDEDSSVWSRLLSKIIPIGIGGLAAYGGYNLGNYMNGSGWMSKRGSPDDGNPNDDVEPVNNAEQGPLEVEDIFGGDLWDLEAHQPWVTFAGSAAHGLGALAAARYGNGRFANAFTSPSTILRRIREGKKGGRGIFGLKSTDSFDDFVKRWDESRTAIKEYNKGLQELKLKMDAAELNLKDSLSRRGVPFEEYKKMISNSEKAVELEKTIKDKESLRESMKSKGASRQEIAKITREINKLNTEKSTLKSEAEKWFIDNSRSRRFMDAYSDASSAYKAKVRAGRPNELRIGRGRLIEAGKALAGYGTAYGLGARAFYLGNETEKNIEEKRRIENKIRDAMEEYARAAAPKKDDESDDDYNRRIAGTSDVAIKNLHESYDDFLSIHNLKPRRVYRGLSGHEPTWKYPWRWWEPRELWENQEESK